MTLKWTSDQINICQSLILLLLLAHGVKLLGQSNDTTEPHYPGGLEALYRYVQENAQYPTGAKTRGIEGPIFMQFVVGASGRILPETIIIVKGIDSLCNQEAIRVLKTNTIAWIPALKNGQPVDFKYNLAIIFKLVPNNDESIAFNPVGKKFKAVVKAKPPSVTTPQWPIYADLAMENKIGKLTAGDTVQIDGWAPWLLHIEGRFNGFISFRSVSMPREFSNLVQLIETESTKLVRLKEKGDSTRKAEKEALWSDLVLWHSNDAKKTLKKKHSTDSLELKNSPSVFLRLLASKKEIKVGECSTVSLSLFVDDRNESLFQFPPDLGKQLDKAINTSLRKENAWIASRKISEIKSEQEHIDRRTYSIFTLHTASYCPINNVGLNFEPITIELDKYKPLQPNQLTQDKVFEKKVPFTSKPLSIRIEPQQQAQLATSADFYNLTGHFRVTEKIDTASCSAGRPCSYSITLEGSGLTYPLSIPKLSNPDFTARFTSRVHMDTAINHTYYSRVTFTYSITFHRKGEIELGQNLFTVINPLTNKLYTLRTNAKINILQPTPNHTNQVSQLSQAKSNFILLDISQSMLIEDYDANRLEFAKNSLAELFSTRKLCDTDLILFSGDVFKYNVSSVDSCFSRLLIGKINYQLSKKIGTAMGDAIWYITHESTIDSRPRKIILISDGENTAGITTVGLAAKLAKKYQISIYTIGIGHSEKAKVGRDLNGNPLLIDHTFSDIDLKYLAFQTGGRYFWVDNKLQLINALKTILSLP